MLVQSGQDDILLAYEVEKRFGEIAQTHVHQRGTVLEIPRGLQFEFRLFMGLRERHRAGDFRHTEAEQSATKAIAQWTVTINCALRGQPNKVVQWKD